MEILNLRLEEIKPYEKNPRNNDNAVDAVANSIREFGFKVPIIIDKDNVIVAGHTRYKASQKLGLKTVPCIKADDLNEEQIKAFRLADNKVSEQATWDFDLLMGELDDLTMDMTQFGFDLPEEEEEMEIVEDEVPDVPEEPKSKYGDIYQLGNHRLMCGDSTKEEDVKKLINNNTIDFVYTDPPYGINLDGDNSKRGSETSLMKGGLKLKSFIDDSTSYAIDAFNIVQSLKIQKQVWWGANYYCHSIPETNNWLIWDKRVEEKMTNTNSDCELAWVLDGHNSCRIFRHLWNGLIKASEQGEKRVHPTQKPVALADFCYKKYAPEAQTIMDLFGGSGSSLMMAEQNNLKMFMMEFDPHYVDVIIQRWENFTGEKARKIEE